MKNSWKNDPHKPKVQGLKLEETYSKRKRWKKTRMNGKNSRANFQREKRYPQTKNSRCRTRQEWSPKPQIKCPSSSLAPLGSVDDGKSKFTTLD